MCLSCGHDQHIRADGACITCGCATTITAWPEDKPAPLKDARVVATPTLTQLPFDDSDKKVKL